jgi:hypothetical protein
MAAIKLVKPCDCDVIAPIAGIFLDENDGAIRVKTSDSEHDGVDISNDENYSYIHNYIIDGTITFDISGVGGGAVTVSSDSFSDSEVAEIQAITSGTMSSGNGYNINEYQLLYKLVIWGYIDNSYTRTVRPYVSINEIQNTNNATEAINYKLPCTTITANKAALTMRTDCLALIWSDGAVLDNEGTETEISGAGSGDFYLFGDYTKLVAINQGISNLDVFSDDLQHLNLSNNSLIITQSHINSIDNLIILNAGDTNSNFTDLSKHINITSILIENTDCVLLSNSILLNSVLETLSFSNTDSVFKDEDLINKANLKTLKGLLSDHEITDVTQNVNLELINLGASPILFDQNTIKGKLKLKTLAFFANNSVFTDNYVKEFINIEIISFSDNSGASVTDVSFSLFNNVKSIILEDSNCTINTSSIINKSSLNILSIANIRGQITAVNVATRIIDVAGLSEQTAANNNTLIQNLIDNTRTGKKELTFTAHADIDQSNVDLLVQAEWDVTQIT